tara:strand:+ start:14857 stop:15876 length:1020 start_codon:yes stop_codon:yes gene_type:complete
MKIHIRGIDVDLDSEVDLFFLNETLIYDKIKQLESLTSTDIYTKIYKKDVTDTYLRRANTGSWDAYKDIVHTYDEERFENVSKDFTMCWKKTNKEHDKLIILLTSYAGHEGRLTSPLTNVSDKIINLDTDLLIVNEDPFRYPESLYPSVMMLGVSEQNNTQEKTCNQIREYIKKEYKNVVIYADSKHVACSLSLAYHLKDIVTNVFLTGGQATFSWNHSPWVKQYMKWHNRPEHLKDQQLAMIYPAILHIVRCWKFKKLNLNNEIIDPFRFLSDYPNIKVDYLYGKYDTDYVSFLHYIKQFECENLSIKEIDYKISESQTHNIRPYVDRKILKEFIESL